MMSNAQAKAQLAVKLERDNVADATPISYFRLHNKAGDQKFRKFLYAGYQPQRYRRESPPGGRLPS